MLLYTLINNDMNIYYVFSTINKKRNLRKCKSCGQSKLIPASAYNVCLLIFLKITIVCGYCFFWVTVASNQM